MSDLLHQLGIDWKLLVSQGANFLILLVALSFLVWRPILRIIEKRKSTIETGLRKSEEADTRLLRVGAECDEKLADADFSAINIIAEGEKKAGVREREILQAAEDKAAGVLLDAERVARQKNQAEYDALMNRARGVIRDAMALTCELDPGKVDESLISKALSEVGEKKYEIQS
jgi:F-type H+-transporting ATPase subunit b